MGAVEGISCLERSHLYNHFLKINYPTNDVDQDDSMEEEGDDHEDGPVLHHVGLHAFVPVVDVIDMSDVHWEESLSDGEVRLVHVEMTEGGREEVEEDGVADQSKHEKLPVELKYQSML